jgi:hypothetical protein
MRKLQNFAAEVSEQVLSGHHAPRQEATCCAMRPPKKRQAKRDFAAVKDRAPIEQVVTILGR